MWMPRPADSCERKSRFPTPRGTRRKLQDLRIARPRRLSRRPCVSVLGFLNRRGTMLIEDALQFAGDVKRVAVLDIAAFHHVHQLAFAEDGDGRGGRGI